MSNFINSEDLNNMMAIAKNLKSTEKDLSPLFGLTGKIDLLLASHENSSPEQLRLLYKVESDSVRRRLIKNPNFPLCDEHIVLANLYPQDFLKLKKVELLPEKNPEKLVGLVSIIQESNCPLEIINYLSINGSVEQRELIFKLGLDPQGSLTKITGKYIYQKSYDLAIGALKSMTYDGLDDALKNNVRVFLEKHRVFAVPKFSPQDKASKLQRCGNLIGGYPFTSKNFPWPQTDGSGMPMQPVFQLVLDDIALVLGEELGSGLLQVWARMDSDEESRDIAAYDNFIFIRHIESDYSVNSLIDDFPKLAPWEFNDCGDDKNGPQAVFPDAPDEMKIGSTIYWIDMGAMWQHPFNVDKNPDMDDYNVRENVFDDLSSIITLPTNAPKIYAGGYGGQAGNVDDPTFYDEGSSIVIRANIGVGMHLGILKKINKSNKPVFSWVLKYYH